jgi:alpha-galactosidase
MLEVGNGMSENEDRAHFSLWCMLAAPLITGNDLRHMPPAVSSILMNKDVIAIDQDPLGIEAFQYSAKEDLEVWAKPLADDAWAICFLNRGTTPKPVEFDWKNENMVDDLSKRQADFAGKTYHVRDIWAKTDLPDTSQKLAATIPGHDVLVLRLSK